METFIYVVGIVVVAFVMWGAYETYRTRQWVEGLAQHAHYVFDQQTKDRGIMGGSPVLFDQEAE